MTVIGNANVGVDQIVVPDTFDVEKEGLKRSPSLVMVQNDHSGKINN